MASYDYNEIQPGASDIDREAWPVMYDPYGDQEGLTEVSTQDTETVDLNGKGTSTSKLSADVKISKQSGNILRKITDGLFASIGGDPVLSIDGSQFIGVTGEPQRPTITLKKSESESNDLKDENGLYVHIPIKEVWGSDSISVDMEGDDREISVVLSPEADNIIQDTPNGLYAAPTASTEIDSSNSITATKNENVYTLSINTDNSGNVQFDITENGLKANVDFPLDTLTGTNPIKVTTEKVGEQDEHVVSLDIASGANNLLDVAPDGLRAVLSTGSDQDHNVQFTGTGTPTSPLKAHVDVPEDFIRGIGETSSLALSVDPVTGELTGDVKIDTTNPGNVTLSFTRDGMVASADIPEDYINNVENTQSVNLNVSDGVLTAEIASGVIPEIQGSSSIDVQKSGSTNTLSAKISNKTGNQLSVDGSNGLYVPPAEIPDVPVKSLIEGEGIDITEDEEHPGNFTIRATTLVQNISAFHGIQASNDVEGTWTFQADISNATGNRLELDQEDDGLYVGPELPQDGSVGQVLKKTADGTEWDDEQEQYITGVQDTDTVSLAVELGQLTATANISSAAGNILEDRGGLYVPNTVIPQEFITSVATTPSIELNVDQNGQLTSDLKIDTTNEGNVHLAITQDGLVASADIPVDYINNVVETDTVILAVDNGDLSATAKVSSRGDNQTDPANALEIEQDGLWTPTLYLGPFDSSARPSDAITGQYIFDTDLGYCLYRRGGAWVNSTGAIIEGNVEPSGNAVDWLVNPMTSYGDLIVGGASGVPERLAVGTEGQELVVGADGHLFWEDKARSCQENFLIVDATNFESASGFSGRILVSRFVCYHDCVCSELGFSIKVGNVGTVGLAIYWADTKDLVARTEMFSTDQTIDGHVLWHETENPYTLVAGQEYYFAIWVQSNVLQVLGKDVTGFDSSIVGCVIGQQSITEMPTTLGTLNTEQFCVHMVAR